jgi:hypothetical protein
VAGSPKVSRKRAGMMAQALARAESASLYPLLPSIGGVSRRQSGSKILAMSESENSVSEQKPWQFQKGQSGNPHGKPKGALNHATRAAQMLLDGEANAITRKCIEMALAGDTIALRLCLERIVPF